MIFALSFLWVYYCIKSAAWAIALASVLAVSSAYIMWQMQGKIVKSKTAKLQNKKAVAMFHDYLKYNDDNAKVFTELYRYYHYEVESVDYDSFVASKDGATTLVCLCFNGNSLTADNLQAAIVAAKRKKTDKLSIYASKIDGQLRKTALQRFDVTFVDLANAYRLLEGCDKLPNIPRIKPAKSSFIAKYAFCRKRFGWYLGSCIFMTLVSIVAYFPYYTLGWATVMLALALYSLFNTRYNGRQTTVTLN